VTSFGDSIDRSVVTSFGDSINPKAFDARATAMNGVVIV
jgi:hypothetical protein